MVLLKIIFCYLAFLLPNKEMHEEFEPLLEGGIHDIQLRDMRDKFSLPFSDNTKRNNLIERFEVFLYRVKELELQFECWVNGSFTTKKDEPNDIDVAFFFAEADINKLSAKKINLLYELFDNVKTKAIYKCDVFFVMNDIHSQFYWKGCFGFSRTNKVKGIAKICY